MPNTGAVTPLEAIPRTTRLTNESRTRRIVLLCAGCAIIAAIAFILIASHRFSRNAMFDCLHSPPTPSETVRRYIELADKGNIDCAFQLLSERQKNSEGGPNFVRGLIVVWISTIHDRGGLTGLEVASERILRDSARVDVKLSVKYTDAVEHSYKLIKESNGWKIDDF